MISTERKQSISSWPSLQTTRPRPPHPQLISLLRWQVLSEKSDFKIQGPTIFTNSKVLNCWNQEVSSSPKIPFPSHKHKVLSFLWPHFAFSGLLVLEGPQFNQRPGGRGNLLWSLFFGGTDQECSPTAIKATKLPNTLSSLSSLIMWEPNTV